MEAEKELTLLQGLAFKGYRSFSSEQFAVLAPLQKINLIAGQNNVGKSNVLRIVADMLSRQSGGGDGNWDRPQHDAEYRPERLVGYAIDEVIGWAREKLGGSALTEQVEEFIRSPELTPPGIDAGNVWFGANSSYQQNQLYAAAVAERVGSRYLVGHLSGELTRTRGGQPGDDAERVFNWVASLSPELHHAVEVGGIREISADSELDPDLNGRSIKARLLKLQNPSSDRLSDRSQFLKIQEFVRAVLDDPGVAIDVPYDLSTIHVTQNGYTLPIENIGTGVHEVVILAAAATITENSVMCIEEPEVHLHPVLQRKLLRYLYTETSNQYFIATHSAHMLDSELGSIFHVTKVEGESRIQFAGAARERAAICADLGFRPSDLVQSNAVLWVEGPSDRIYLKHWIDKLRPGQFIEGTHYSIMFYGGSLLRELSPLDAEEVDDFISLRALNRYLVVLMDSDRTSSHKKLNATKRRVIEAIQQDSGNGVAWVTSGYTIENYVPAGVLEAAVHAAHPSTKKKKLSEFGRWVNPLSADRLGLTSPSKVSIAKEAVKQWQDEWPFDLKKKVEEVVRLVEVANAHH